MSWIMIVLLLVAAFLILVPLLAYISARRLVGKEIAATHSANQPENRLIYFYSANCGPCRNMTPSIDRLAESNREVSKVDVQADPQTARDFNIRATPTTLLVKKNRILDVVLGSKSEKQLTELLQRVIE